MKLFTSRPDVMLWSECSDSISFSTMAPSRHSSRLLKPLTCRGYWPNCSILHKVLPKQSHRDVSNWEENSYWLSPWQKHIQISYPRVFFQSQRSHRKAAPWGSFVCLLRYWNMTLYLCNLENKERRRTVQVCGWHQCITYFPLAASWNASSSQSSSLWENSLTSWNEDMT